MEQVLASLSGKQFSEVLGLAGDFWKSKHGTCGYGHHMTLYNAGNQVFCFMKEYNRSGGCDHFCVALLAGHAVDEGRDRSKKVYDFPSPVFHGYVFGKAIVRVSNIRSHTEYFTIEPRQCLHLVRWFSDEVEDYDKYRFQKLSVRNSFFRKVFGEQTLGEIRKSKVNIGKRILDLLTCRD